MRNFKIKLLFPPSLYYQAYTIYKSPVFPYGLGVLTAFLRNNNYNVVLDDLLIKIEANNKKLWFSPRLGVDLNVLRCEKEIIDYICDKSQNKKINKFTDQITQLSNFEGYDLIGISVMDYSAFLSALLLCKKIKSLYKTKVVLGGPFISAYGKELFEQFRITDYMIVGDGQIPLLRFIEHLDKQAPIEGVSNLLYRQNGTVKINSRKIFPIEDVSVPDLSDLPLDFYRYQIENIGLMLPYQTSRGCTHNCSFCKRTTVNPYVESKSYNKVVTELKVMKERYKSKNFWFCDDTTNCSYEHLDKLCDMFIEKKIDISWRAFARADNLDRNILHKMKKAGCAALIFGIESGSDKILKGMRKDFNIEQAAQVLKVSYQEGIKNIPSFISGFPHEGEQDTADTIKFIKENRQYIYSITAFRVLRVEHGTPLYSNPEMFGIENIRPIFDASHTLSHRYFAFDEINGLKWEEKVKQQEYSLKKISRADFKYILSKKYHFTSFVPFWLYF